MNILKRFTQIYFLFFLFNFSFAQDISNRIDVNENHYIYRNAITTITIFGCTVLEEGKIYVKNPKEIKKHLPFWVTKSDLPKSNITFMEASITHTDQSVTKLKRKNLQSISIENDCKSNTIDFANIQAGYILHYKIKLNIPENFSIRPWTFQTDLPIQESKIEFETIKPHPPYDIVFFGDNLLSKYNQPSTSKLIQLHSIKPKDQINGIDYIEIQFKKD